MAVFRRGANIIVLTLAMNSFIDALYFDLSAFQDVILFIASAALIVLINLYPVPVTNSVFRSRSIKKGHELLLLFSATFLLNTAVNVLFGLLLVPAAITWWLLAINIAVCLLFELVLLLNGLSRAFFTSLQLGVKWRWGNSCRVVTVSGKRGVSHGDMIDLNRENIADFDVRELYVDIASGLKAMAL